MTEVDKTQQAPSHQAVMLAQTLESLQVEPEGCYIDGTLGRGGHSQAILDRLNDNGRLLVFDKDPEAIAWAKQYWAHDSRVRIWHGSFADMGWVTQQFGLSGSINGIILDLGVASPQLDQAERGFSFNQDGPLDMRMNHQQGQSAAQWLEEVEEQQLADVLYHYADERFAKRIARAIKQHQQHDSLKTTEQLAQLIKQTVPKKEKHKHPATRSFQAIRMAVNNELGDLEKALELGVECLVPGGRFVVISFHSVEDRLVKRFFKNGFWPKPTPPDLPIRQPNRAKRLQTVKQPIKADQAETQVNPRARSATLRVAEKLKEEV